MLANYLIGLREGVEAGLIVGILVAYLRQANRRDVLPKLWTGIGLAVGASVALGALLTWGPDRLGSDAQEVLGSSLSILAVGLVTWMIFWMRSHARALRSELASKLDAAMAGSGIGIVLVGAVSVAREGIETVLFVWAAIDAAGTEVLGLVGAVLGIVTALLLAWLIYRGFVRVNLARFFTWTAGFLALVAAGVLAHTVGDLQETGILGEGQAAFSMAGAIPDSSWYGTLLGGVFNFTAEPTWAQVGTWLGYLAAVGGAMSLPAIRRWSSIREIPPVSSPS